MIREALSDHKAGLTERLWTLLENPKNDQDQRFRAACALAAFAPDDPRWEKVSDDVAATLVVQKPFVHCPMDRSLEGCGALADSAAGRLSCGRETQRLGTRVDRHCLWQLRRRLPDAYARLEKQLDEKSAPDAPVDAKIALAKKQASVGRGPAGHGPGREGLAAVEAQPRSDVRSYLIDRLGPGGVDPKVLTARLEEEQRYPSGGPSC